MASIPFVFLMGIIAFCMVKWGKSKAGGMMVGCLFGLLLATTAVGPPIVSAATSAEQAIISGFAKAVGN